MKKLLIIIILFSSFFAISQETETAEEKISYDKAVTYSHPGKNEKALESFTLFLKNSEWVIVEN